jgi:hypothetical protein
MSALSGRRVSPHLPGTAQSSDLQGGLNVVAVDAIEIITKGLPCGVAGSKTARAGLAPKGMATNACGLADIEAYSSRCISPSLNILVTIAVRDVTPSFAKILRRCVETVQTLISNTDAIILLG